MQKRFLLELRQVRLYRCILDEFRAVDDVWFRLLDVDARESEWEGDSGYEQE